jgi:hypothetical protein
VRNLEAQLALPDSLLMQGKVTSKATKATNIRNGAAIEQFGARRTLTEVDFDDLNEALAAALKDKEELTTKLTELTTQLTELTKLAACSENDRAGGGPGLARRRGEGDSDCVSALSPGRACSSSPASLSSHESPRPATPPSPPVLGEGSPSFLGEAAEALARLEREEGVEALARELEEASLEVAEENARVAEENAGAQCACFSTGVQNCHGCYCIRRTKLLRMLLYTAEENAGAQCACF